MRASPHKVGATIALVLLAGMISFASPAAAEVCPIGGLPCIPTPSVPNLPSLPNPVTAVTDAGFGKLKEWMIDTAKDAVENAIKAGNDVTKVDLEAGWAQVPFSRTLALGLTMAAILLVLAAGEAGIKLDLASAGRALATAPVVVLLSYAAVPLTQKFVEVADAIAVDLAPPGELTAQTSAYLGRTLNADAAVGGVGFTTVSFAILAFAAFIVFLELVLRSALIYAITMFLPVALSGLCWHRTKQWSRRTLEVLFGVIVAKPLVLGLLSLGLSALGGQSSSGLSPVIIGGAVFLVAAFIPVTVIKVTGVAAAGAEAGISEARSRGTGAAMAGVGTAVGVAGLASGNPAAAGAAGGGGRKIAGSEAPSVGGDGGSPSPVAPGPAPAPVGGGGQGSPPSGSTPSRTTSTPAGGGGGGSEPPPAAAPPAAQPAPPPPPPPATAAGSPPAPATPPPPPVPPPAEHPR